MMIVLAVLKWVGIIVLLLLLLILFLFLLLLFIPLRYELHFKRDGMRPDAGDLEEEALGKPSSVEGIGIKAVSVNGDLSEEAVSEELQEPEEKKKPSRRYLLSARLSWFLRFLQFRYFLDNEGSRYSGKLAFFEIVSSEEGS